MIKLVLAAAALAIATLPAAAVAQPYHSSQPYAGSSGYQGGDYGRDDGDGDYGDDGARNYGDQKYGSQPYGDQSQDQGYRRDGYGSPQANDYGDDSAYQGDEGQRPDMDRDDIGGQHHFTGRVGATWRDDSGRRCQWREVTRRDADGYDATKWVALCRD